VPPVPIPPPPSAGRDSTLTWVGEHLAGLWAGPLTGSARFTGGMAAAAGALAALDVTGYAGRRSEVWPPGRRGASALSPWIRHGLLTLPAVWQAAGDGPARDVRRYRGELLWQEYARHLYARIGTALGRPVRYRPASGGAGGDGWPRSMACMDLTVSELERDGWLVNQTRMWLASQWTVRHQLPWRDGEDRFFAQLLDGSRAANRLGWQWTIGAGTGKAYGFSRWQVEKRAKGVCDGCQLRDRCPIERWPGGARLERADEHPRLRRDTDPAATAGPRDVERSGGGPPEAVWLTAESLGDGDPALAAEGGLPAVFVFDRPLLERLQLSAKRLVFLTECLGDLAERRPVEVHVGDPVDALAGRRLAATFTPVPGWRVRRARLELTALHPWPWLRRPAGGPVTSFSAWRKGQGA
jgi:deoxyribodipyrimidine photo-lyase